MNPHADSRHYCEFTCLKATVCVAGVQGREQLLSSTAAYGNRGSAL